VLGGRLIEQLRAMRLGLLFAGIGGERMAEQGVESLFPMRELALMGLLEVLPNIRNLSRRMDQTVAEITALRPAALVTIDSPGFALRIAKRVKPLGIPVIHYVAPQVWAWRQGRVKEMAHRLDRILALLPFEPPFFESAGIRVTFALLAQSHAGMQAHTVAEQGMADTDMRADPAMLADLHTCTDADIRADPTSRSDAGSGLYGAKRPDLSGRIDCSCRRHQGKRMRAGQHGGHRMEQCGNSGPRFVGGLHEDSHRRMRHPPCKIQRNQDCAGPGGVQHPSVAAVVQETDVMRTGGLQGGHAMEDQVSIGAGIDLSPTVWTISAKQ